MPRRMVTKGNLFFGWALLVMALLALSPCAPAQAGGVAAAGVAARITEAIDESKLVTLTGNTHPLARPEFDKGAAPDSLPMERMLLVLRRGPDQEAALATLLDQQQDKTSPNYHQWFTPDAFGQQFGPAQQDIQTITSWLQSHGFQVNRITRGRMVIEFSGTVSQVRQAFHTQIHKYTVANKDHWANSSDPQIPVALTPAIAGVDSLHNFPRKAMNHVAGVFARSKETGQVRPVQPQFNTNIYNCTGGTCYAVAPADFATIYNVPNELLNPLPAPSVNGNGIGVAIVGDSEICTQHSPDWGTTYISPITGASITCNSDDVQLFRQMFGLSASNLPTVIVDGPDPGFNTDETEADLDAEWAGAVAPNAIIELVIAESTESSAGVDLAAEDIVDNNIASVMSESFGACEASLGASGNQFYYQLWQQAAAEGISVMVAAGDSGAAGCDSYSGSVPEPAQDGLAVSGIASTPFDVAVGGTDFNDALNPLTYWNNSNGTNQESAKGYIPETTWNDTCTNSQTFSLTGAKTPEANCNSLSSKQAIYITTSGGGGGESNCINGNGATLCAALAGYAQPSWQKNIFTDPLGFRDLPDISLFASDGFLTNSFFAVCESDATSPASACSLTNFLGIGGTSAPSPMFAGIMALVNQQTGSRQGNANYVLYNLAEQALTKQGGAPNNNANSTWCVSAAPAGLPSTCVFYDIPTGSTIAMPCAKGSTNCTPSGSDTYGVLPGYSTTTGYDLATGLGSINAANLINAWNAVETSLAPTTTTLILNGGAAVNITHGQSVNVNVQVTSGGGTPTGNVSLIAQLDPSLEAGVQSYTLSGGTATCTPSPCTTALLPGGSYSVFARYSGDGTFHPSDSPPPWVSVTVNPEASKTVITIPVFSPVYPYPETTNTPTSLVYGSPYYGRVDVGCSSGACAPPACTPPACPTGSITWTDTYNGGPATPLDGGTFNLNAAGYFEDQLIQLPAGKHVLNASYGGDPSFNSSAATAYTLTITQAPTATTVTSNVSTIASGGMVTLGASISSSSNSLTGPSGNVQFLSDGVNLGSAQKCTPTGATYTPAGALVGASCTASLTIALSNLPQGPMSKRPGRYAPGPLPWLAALFALFCLLLGRRLSSRKRGYAYAGFVFFLLLGAASCGGSGGGGGGGTPSPVNRSITAMYSGDTNYSESTSSAINITVQ